MMEYLLSPVQKAAYEAGRDMQSFLAVDGCSATQTVAFRCEYAQT